MFRCCYKCPDRYLACGDYCQTYKDEKKRDAERKAAIYADKHSHGYDEYLLNKMKNSKIKSIKK